MTAREFFYLVTNMRDTQRRYFDTREQTILRAARALENDVDREIRRVKDILDRNDTYQDSGCNGRHQIIIQQALDLIERATRLQSNECYGAAQERMNEAMTALKQCL